jgi:hypothetical protein
MVSVGVGMCLSNARAVWQGYTRRHLEFRRTPKFSVTDRQTAWKRKVYRSGNPLAALVETAFAVYFLVALSIAYALKEWISVPFLALFGFGYAYVAFLTALHGFSSWQGANANANAVSLPLAKENVPE